MKNSAYRSMLLLMLGLSVFACDNNSIRFQDPDGDLETTETDFLSGDGDGTVDGDGELDDILGENDVDEDTPSDGDWDSDVDEEASRCRNALALHCGDRYSHSMSVQGLPNEWYGYSCTQRGEGGDEAIYSFQTDVTCQVELRLKNLQADIDLLLLDACDPWSCVAASPTPMDIQQDEEIRFTAEPGQRYFVVVDGYADASGSYTLSADCACEEINCLDAGGFCNDYSDTCSMGTKRADHLHCDTGVCCVPMTCSEAGGSCFSETCPQGWEIPRYGDTFTCENGGTCCVQNPGANECPQYRASLAQCPFQYFHGSLDWPDCPELLICMDDPCRTDADCHLMDSAQLGGYCVTGNCVYCWQDSQCPDEMVCRGGRCLKKANDCPAPSDCTGGSCRLVEISEQVCPVCVCDTVFDDSCERDEQCQPLSHHYFQHCVNGRCAECRHDGECAEGLQCLPPGLCYSMTEHPSSLYGSWLIGWWGALNHYSYFRFEPDGTLRRGSYMSNDLWMDSIVLDNCSYGAELPSPLLGTWEPEVTQSGFLIIRTRFQQWCTQGMDMPKRWKVVLNPGGDFISLVSIDHPGSMDLEGWRVDPQVCTPDFAECDPPEFPSE